MRFIPIFTFATFFASSAAILGQGPAKKIEQTIKALDAEWCACAPSKNVDLWMAFYAPNAVLLSPNEPVADTPAKIKKSMAAFLSLPDLSLSFGSDKVWVAGSLDVAYEYGHYSLSFKDDKGNTVKDQGKYTEVWRKQKSGKWLCVMDMFNSDLPMGS